MKTSLMFLSAPAFCAVLGGCSARTSTTENDTGQLTLSLRETPADVRCLRITFEGSQSATRLLELTPSQPVTFHLERLPVGLTTIDASAHALPCDSVAPGTLARYVLDSPALANIEAHRPTSIVLSLVANGVATVDVDFIDPDSGADGEPLTLAVIGDTPYGAAQLDEFPALIQALDASGVDAVVHVGDIKNGSTRCDDAYFERIFGHFQALGKPLYYTPGDNEWTDCHRANNGAFDPIERLGALRSIFFARPDVTLGVARPVLSQARIPAHATFVENQIWYDARVVFASVHVVGSSNGDAPWFGTDTTGTLFDDPERRTAEVHARTAAALDWIGRAFDLAALERASGLVLFMQADTFQGSSDGFSEIVGAIADRAQRFERPVLLVQGDSHRHLVDRPFQEGNSRYGIVEPVPNITRVVVEGETTREWLEITVDPSSASVFHWERRSRGG